MCEMGMTTVTSAVNVLFPSAHDLGAPRIALGH